MHALPASQAASAPRNFAMLASPPHGWPASKSAAALSRMSCAASVETCEREIANCTPWLAPMGRPQRTRGVRGGGRDVRARDRELHALVGADGPAEDDALVRVRDRLLDEPARIAERV